MDSKNSLETNNSMEPDSDTSAAPIPKDETDPPTPWLRYIVDSIQSKPPLHVAKMPVERNAVYYNMNHRHRGLALIFNHEVFHVHNLKPRSGTNHDSTNLRQCFETLGFEVWPYNDLTGQELKDTIKKASEYDHNNSDCIIVAVLTHGEHGILYAKDTPYKPESLWAPFTGDLCPSLAGKPKLFFIQACQGDKLDSGVQMRTETDGGAAPYKIPIHADFLIAYSTIPGFYSWRNTTRGSWFMQALCQELEENGFVLDLLTILTFVNQRVALDFESNTPDNSLMHQQKQIPCITYMLTRLVKFTRKSSF